VQSLTQPIRRLELRSGLVGVILSVFRCNVNHVDKALQVPPIQDTMGRIPSSDIRCKYRHPPSSAFNSARRRPTALSRVVVFLASYPPYPLDLFPVYHTVRPRHQPGHRPHLGRIAEGRLVEPLGGGDIDRARPVLTGVYTVPYYSADAGRAPASNRFLSADCPWSSPDHPDRVTGG